MAIRIISNVSGRHYRFRLIMAQYSDKQFEFPENKVKATAVIRVEIESMTGKQAGF